MNYPMQRTFAAVMLLCCFVSGQVRAQQAAPALSTSVGAVKLAVPHPDGYVDPSGPAPQIIDFMQSTVPPTNRFLGILIPPADLKLFLSGKEAPLNRYYAIQTMRATEHLTITPVQFAQMRQIIREQQATMMDKAKAMAQESLDKGARKIGEKIDDESFALKIGEVKGLGVFHESDTAISFAATSQMAIRHEGKTQSGKLIFTSTAVLVKGKLLFLYVYSSHRGEADVRWTRDEAIKWTAAVQQAN